MVGKIILGIRVNLYGPLVLWAGNRSYEGEGSTIREVFSSLETQLEKSLLEHLLNDETGEVKSHFHILLNGKDTELQNGIDQTVKEGDIITVVPPVGGG